MPVAGKVIAASNCKITTVYKREPDNGPRRLLKANHECYTNVFALRQSSNIGSLRYYQLQLSKEP
jgi:hypothetical protein